MTTKLDPTDLSALYFADASTRNIELYTVEQQRHCVYCHPDLQVAASGTVQGRGLTVKRDVRAGECLFVTPPVARANVDDVLRRYHRASAQDRSTSLEYTSEQVLLEAMRTELQTNTARAWSILTLVGLDDGLDNIPSSSALRTPSLDLLTALETAAPETLPEGNLGDVVSDAHLLRIIRRNAFGPDFVSYERLERHPHVRPFRLLGIYPLAAMINHSCISNAVRAYAGEAMVVHASQPIPAGAEILWSYVSPIDPMRQDILRQQHGFACRCEQCRATSQSNLLSEQLHLDPSLEALSDKYNRRLLPLDALSDAERREVRHLVAALEEGLSRAPSSGLSNTDKRYLRLGFMHLYLHYLNLTIGAEGGDIDSHDGSDHPSSPAHLTLITQLHLAFCASHNASTEHLSILHLAYELVGTQHLRTKHDDGPESTKTRSTFQFWTRQLQLAHQIRYGKMGNDLGQVRRCLQHTQGVLRRRNGFEAAQYTFL